MKKLITVIITVSIMLLLVSCTNNPETKNNNDEGGVISVSKSMDFADIDLTKISNTMVYSQLYNMVINPR
jgi:PBP1b-binding outer membrane lipoprotein LpoB